MVGDLWIRFDVPVGWAVPSVLYVTNERLVTVRGWLSNGKRQCREVKMNDRRAGVMKVYELIHLRNENQEDEKKERSK
jgi:hypothetical protein